MTNAASILVVEDETAQLEMLRYNLEKEGYNVIGVEDGEEALLVAREEMPDVVLAGGGWRSDRWLDLCGFRGFAGLGFVARIGVGRLARPFPHQSRALDFIFY